jgi:hypothetical protein
MDVCFEGLSGYGKSRERGMATHDDHPTENLQKTLTWASSRTPNRAGVSDPKLGRPATQFPAPRPASQDFDADHQNEALLAFT